MARILTRLKWKNEQSTEEKIERELKRKAKALLDYASKNGIGYLDIVTFPGYISCVAKKNSEEKNYILNTHTFTEREVDE